MPASGQQASFDHLTDEEWAQRVVAAGNLPQHVAIIMDGNGRWARRRLLPRVAGHRAGRHAVRSVVRICSRLGIKVLTLYPFSQENWKRPPAEVRALWSFLEETLAAECDDLKKNGVRLVATGETGSIPPPALRALENTIDRLKENDGLVLNLALAYGGRTEILRAAVDLARRIAEGRVDPAAVDEEDFRPGLYSPDLPDPDLVIRTSGEFRLSNFLLWQSAYSEFHVTSVLWPDFRERDLLLAISDYQNRERRFGAVRNERPDKGDSADRSPLDPSVWKRLLKVRS